MTTATIPKGMTPKALRDIAKILDGLVGFIGRIERKQFKNAEGGPIPDDQLEGFFDWLLDPEMQNDLRRWASDIEDNPDRPECDIHLNRWDKNGYCYACGYK